MNQIYLYGMNFLDSISLVSTSSTCCLKLPMLYHHVLMFGSILLSYNCLYIISQNHSPTFDYHSKLLLLFFCFKGFSFLLFSSLNCNFLFLLFLYFILFTLTINKNYN